MIAAVLLAAGESRRMGRPKLTLPWGGGESLIVQLVERFRTAGADPILMVTGGHREAVEQAVDGTGVRCVFNPEYTRGGMLSSIMTGLRQLQSGPAEAALLTPADLPSLTAETIRALIARRQETGADLIAPSFRMRRGHPVLIGRALWQSVLDLADGETLRDFLRRQAQQIEYVVVQDPGVIQDIDTREDYERGVPC